jgi:hypothetical protein
VVAIRAELCYKNHCAHANSIQVFISETTTWTSNTLEQFLVVRFELLARKGSWSSLNCIVLQYMLWQTLSVLPDPDPP